MTGRLKDLLEVIATDSASDRFVAGVNGDGLADERISGSLIERDRC